MKQITMNIYEYNELSDEAKEVVKQDFLNDGFRLERLIEDFRESWVEYFFQESNLKTEFSLSYSQGDGVNIYGVLELRDVINFIKNYNEKEHLENSQLETEFVESELKKLFDYFQFEDVELQNNNRGAYCVARYIDFADNYIEYCKEEELEYDEELIRKFEKATVQILEMTCAEMEKHGYDYLYEISEDEITDICEANEYMFYENGLIYS